MDTSERDHALRQLEEEKRLRIRAQREEAQALLQQNLARSECDRLRDEVSALREENRHLRDQLTALSSGSSRTLPFIGAGEGCSVRRGDTEAMAEEDGSSSSSGSGHRMGTDRETSRNMEGRYRHMKSMVISQVSSGLKLVELGHSNQSL